LGSGGSQSVPALPKVYGTSASAEVPLAQGSARRTVRVTEATLESLKVARTGTWTWPPGATVWRGEGRSRAPVKGLG